ncbi:hypothetical protein ACLZX5_04085 [Enterococcus faecium]
MFSDSRTIETKGENEDSSTDVKETNSFKEDNISTDTSTTVQPSEEISSNNALSDNVEETNTEDTSTTVQPSEEISSNNALSDNVEETNTEDTSTTVQPSEEISSNNALSDNVEETNTEDTSTTVQPSEEISSNNALSDNVEETNTEDTSTTVQPSEEISSNNALSDNVEEINAEDLNEDKHSKIEEDLLKLKNEKDLTTMSVADIHSSSKPKTRTKRQASDADALKETNAIGALTSNERKLPDVNAVFDVTNIRFKNSHTSETQDLAVDILVDWEGSKLKAGNFFEIDMPEEFDSVQKIVKSNFSANGIEKFGAIVLDYEKEKLSLKSYKTWKRA